MTKRKPNAQPNQSLMDGIATLHALSTSDKPIGGRELARQLGFEPTRVNRLLKTLSYMGIARQTADRKYTSGPGMYVLAAHSLFASGLMRNALPALESLRRFNHTVALGVLWRDNVSYLYHALPGMSSVDALGRIGLFPATKGGIGLVLMAKLPFDEVRELYHGRDIPGFKNITALIAELKRIRSQGYARVLVYPDREQHTVAVAVGEPAHAAVAVSGWIPENNTDEIVSALREVADAIDTLGNELSDDASKVSEVHKSRPGV